MATHTDGPWHTEYDPDAFAPQIMVRDDSGKFVAEVMFADRHPVSTSTDEALANARLMAAAPRMLAALRNVYANVLAASWVKDVADAIAEAVEDDRS